MKYILLLLTILFLNTLHSQSAVNGSLDNSFNPHDIEEYNIVGANNTVKGIVKQSDGKYIIFGDFYEFLGDTIYKITRLNSDLTRDLTFCDTVIRGYGSYISEVQLQNDGKILVAGDFQIYDPINPYGLDNPYVYRHLIRLNTNGTMDTTFQEGKATYQNSSNNAYIYSLNIQQDGKIIVTGRFDEFNDSIVNHIFRLNTNGSVDESFNIGTGPNDRVQETKSLDNGDLLVIGAFTEFNNVPVSYFIKLNSDGNVIGNMNLYLTQNPIGNGSIKLTQDDKFYLFGYNGVQRYNLDGSEDLTFNPISVSGMIKTIIFLDSDTILIGGDFDEINSLPRNNLSKHFPDGSIDNSFTLETTESVHTICHHVNSRLLIGGEFTQINQFDREFFANISLTDANPVKTFGLEGTWNSISKVVSQYDSKILCITNNYPNQATYNGTNVGALFRLLPNGEIDSTFLNNIGLGIINGLYDIHILPNGKILLAGSFQSFNGDITVHNIARLNQDGTVDNTFSSPTVTDNPYNATILSIAVEQDGSIIIGGNFKQINGVSKHSIAKLNEDGTLGSLDSPFSGNVSVSKVDTASNSKIFAIRQNMGIANNFYRLNTDGSVDGNFNNLLPSSKITDFKEMANGEIIIVGYGYLTQSDDPFILRLDEDGSYDYSTNSDISGILDADYIGWQPNQIEQINPNHYIILGQNLNPTQDYRFMSIDEYCKKLPHFEHVGKISGNYSSFTMQDNNIVVSTGDYINDQLVNHIGRLYFNENCYTSQNEIIVQQCTGNYTSPTGNYIWNTSGNYIDTLTNQCGYDSLIFINLTIDNIPTFHNTFMEICPGESYTFPDGTSQTNITTGLDYISNLTSVLTGCDSIITTNLIVMPTTFIQNGSICSGQSYVFPDGTTETNVTTGFDQISTLTSILTGCDSIITTSVIVQPSIDVSTILNGITITVAETNVTYYDWFDCDNSLSLGPLPFNSVEMTSPGTYAVEVTKNGCIDTSDCITITNQDFYDLPNYTPLSAEAFPLPVSALDTCDGIALGFGNGGFPPYSYDWYTQVNNDYSDVTDSLCEGFHTLKIYDMIGDSAFVDYYVTDSTNWYDWYDSTATFVDTIYMVDENCLIDMNAPIDFTYISDFHYLYSGSNPNEDYYYLEMSYSQAGLSFVIGDTVLMESNGMYLIDFSIYCPSKASNRIKTIVTSLDYPTILNVGLKKDILDVTLYPNPTSGDVILNIGKTNTNSTLTITDLSGKRVYIQSNINDSQFNFTMNDLESGIYFVNMKSGGKQKTIKLVKQ